MFRCVIVPLDGSALSEQALEYGAAMAEKFAAPIMLVRAYEGPERSAQLLAMMQSQPGPGGMVDPATVEAVTEAAEAQRAEARSYLDTRVERLTARGLQAEAVVVDAPAADAILDVAKSRPEPLVVMSTHGRGGLGRLVFGSVAQEVLHKAHVPLLLVRVSESRVSPAETGEPGAAMNVSIGDEVMGTGGKLGEVSRVIADARTDRVTDLVVKHGFIFGGERIVPLNHVTRAEDGVVSVDLDQQGFEAMAGYTEEPIRGPDPDYIGPPPVDDQGTFRGNAAFDQLVAAGHVGALGSAGKLLGYPGGERLTPDDMARPAITRGVEVIDVNGEKVGEVGELSVSTASGAPTRLVVRRGLIFTHDTDVPLAWIQELSDQGVVLNVTRSEVEALVQSS